MKNLFKNLNLLGLAGIVLVALLVFTQSAFKSGSARAADGEYYFNGQDASQINDPAAWDTQLNQNQFRCVIDETLPCKISIPAGQTLASYLNGHTADEVTENSLSKRAPAL